MSEGGDRSEGVRHAAVPAAARFEKRWWMWALALGTLFLTADVRIRLGRSWDHWLLAESIAALAFVIVTCGKWRGRFMSAFLAVGAAMCIVKAVQVGLGT